MENLNKRAVSEVIQILNHTEKEIIERIPEKFIKFLFDNADNEYEPNIDFFDENWENSIDEDAKALLALIYRDYIASDNERNELLEEERKENAKQEELLREKYNPDNLFKKKCSCQSYYYSDNCTFILLTGCRIKTHPHIWQTYSQSSALSKDTA